MAVGAERVGRLAVGVSGQRFRGRPRTIDLVQIFLDFMQRHAQRQRLANGRRTLRECHGLFSNPFAVSYAIAHTTWRAAVTVA